MGALRPARPGPLRRAREPRVQLFPSAPPAPRDAQQCTLQIGSSDATSATMPSEDAPTLTIRPDTEPTALHVPGFSAEAHSASKLVSITTPSAKPPKTACCCVVKACATKSLTRSSWF